MDRKIVTTISILIALTSIGSAQSKDQVKQTKNWV